MKIEINPKFKVPVNLDKERFLYYGLNAFHEYKRVTGTSLIKWFVKLQQAIETSDANAVLAENLEDLVYIIWAGLVTEDPNLTPKDVTFIIDSLQGEDLGSRLQNVLEAVFQALTKAFGESKKADSLLQDPQNPAQKIRAST